MDIYAFLNYNTLLTILFGFLTLFFGLENKRLNEEKRRINWEDLLSLTKELKQKIYKKYEPEIFFSPCRRGATIANLMFLANDNISLYVGIREDLREKKKLKFQPKGYEIIPQTGKYNHYIPKSLLEETKSNLLILDDFTDTGDSLKSIVDFLLTKGFDENRIKTATVVCSETAHRGGKNPNFDSITMPPDFYFPWGRAI